MQNYEVQKDCKLGYFERVKKGEKIEVITGDEFIERYDDIPAGGAAFILYRSNGKQIGGASESQLENLLVEGILKSIND